MKAFNRTKKRFRKIFDSGKPFTGNFKDIKNLKFKRRGCFSIGENEDYIITSFIQHYKNNKGIHGTSAFLTEIKNKKTNQECSLMTYKCHRRDNTI